MGCVGAAPLRRGNFLRHAANPQLAAGLLYNMIRHWTE